jgi:DNA-binding transcriptional LysR family regulator
MQLERRLSARLLNRTSRRVSLTETGALYFEQARQMLDSLDEIEAVVSKATVVPRGMLKLSAPVWLANPVAKVVFHMVAAPAYLDRCGRPRTPQEFQGHALLKYALIPGSTSPFKGADGEQTVAFDVVLQSENETLLHLAAVEGLGIAFLPKSLIAQDIANKRLELLPPGLLPFEGQLFSVYPSRKYLSAKVRTFIDFIAADPRLS